MSHILKWFGTIIVLCVPFSSSVAQSSIIYFFENFDADIELPLGWIYSGPGWQVSTVATAPESAPNNIMLEGLMPGTLMTPAIDLRNVVSGTFSYRVRRSSTYERTAMVVRASIDGGMSYPFILLDAGEALPSVHGVYEDISVVLPASLCNKSAVSFMFYGNGGMSGSANFRLDDITLTIPALHFGRNNVSLWAGIGQHQEQTVTVFNRSTREVSLQVPQLEGMYFSVQPNASRNVGPGSTAEYTITFSPQSQGQFTGRLAVSTSEGISTEVHLSGLTSVQNRFGFNEANGTAFEDSPIVEVPMTLVMSRTEGLQGLQFQVSWNSDDIMLATVSKGNPVADDADWTLSTETDDRSARIVLFHQGVTGLEPGLYESLVVLSFSSAPIVPREETQVAVQVDHVIGSLALPTGDDAGLVTDPGSYHLTLTAKPAEFIPSASVVNFGSVQAGDTSETSIVVSNPSHSRSLTISQVTSSNVLFSVSPDHEVIPPGDHRSFNLAFRPTVVKFGSQESRLTFQHNGTSGPSSHLELKGVGINGAGDVDGTGCVDALDLVNIIDYILGRKTPTQTQKASSDLWPFGAGDGQFDVRDLTVMAQAIVRGKWPEGSNLPSNPAAAGKSETYLARIDVFMETDLDAPVLRIRQEIPVRAIQLEIKTTGVRDVLPVLDQTETILYTYFDPEGQIARILLFRLDGEPISPGDYPVVQLEVSQTASLSPLFLLAVGETGNRVAVHFESTTITGIEDIPETLTGFTITEPYPNPYPVTSGTTLTWTIHVPEQAFVEFGIYDLLGRIVDRWSVSAGQGDRVTWDGRNRQGQPVAPGLYWITATTGQIAATRSIIITR